MVRVFKKYPISIENIAKLMFIEHDKSKPIILKKGKVSMQSNNRRGRTTRVYFTMIHSTTRKLLKNGQ